MKSPPLDKSFSLRLAAYKNGFPPIQHIFGFKVRILFYIW